MAGRPARPDSSNVFLNCPLDRGYAPLFEVMVFTVYACGFRPRCALEEADSGEVRVDKIARLIRECHYAIHNISRVELDPVHRLPRFNMPFELGLDLAFAEALPAICEQQQINRASLNYLDFAQIVEEWLRQSVAAAAR